MLYGVSLAMHKSHLKFDTNYCGSGWRKRYWKAYKSEYLFLFATVSFMWEKKLLFQVRQLKWIMFCISLRIILPTLFFL